MSLVINTVTGQTLSRSYGRLFAEFLDEESLVHLGLLDLSTCVGLRYGRLVPERSWTFLVSTFTGIRTKVRFIRSHFYYLDGYNHESAPATIPRTSNKVSLVREY